MPAIDDVFDLLCFAGGVSFSEVTDHPFDEVILECPFDQLVEEVR